MLIINSAFFIIFVLISTPTLAAGNLGVDLSVFYSKFSKTNDSESGGSSTLSTSKQYLHGGACYFTQENFCLGIKYISLEVESTLSSENGNSTISSNSSSVEKWTGTGLEAGYRNKEVNLRVAYIFDGKYVNSTAEYYDGTSYQVDIGYGFNVKSTMLGPMLTYAKFGYKKKKIGSIEATLEKEIFDEWIMPSLAIWMQL